MADAPVTYQGLVSRAAVFAAEWATEVAERAEKDTFWNDFFQIFGIRRKRVATYEHQATRLSTGHTGHIDVFWPGKIAVEHKSAGKDLDEAMDQLFDYLTGGSIKDAQLPDLAVVSDFANFVVRDLNNGEEHRFPTEELPDHIGLFGSLAGFARTVEEGHEDAANAEAAELLGRIHDELVDAGYTGHELRVLLVRLLFLLFADDTRVWGDGPGMFASWVHTRTKDDGSDLGHTLIDWFEVLNTPEDERSKNLDDDLRSLPWVNGGLFKEPIRRPFCNAKIRDRILEASRFDWSVISPAVFGSMFQSVMDPEDRRHLGAHYTTEANIRKVIDSLFLDDLKAELEACGNGRSWQSKQKLRLFHEKLAGLNFFDPACGCGNFLVVAYRELRRLELEVHKRLRAKGGRVQLTLTDLESMNLIKVSQFYGVEIEEFPSQIAQTAMWLAEHIANLELGDWFGVYFAQFPLSDPAHIHFDNALTLDWRKVLPADRCSFLYGNPPFSGHALAGGDDTMKADKVSAFASVAASDLRVGRLDYVAAWYALAIPYLADGGARAAFVSTNSITQGEQARSLGPLFARHGIKIDFAHRTFPWTSEARGRAAVHVVIIGFSPRGRRSGKPVLFEYPDPKGPPLRREARNLNFYLTDGPDIYPAKRNAPIVAGLPNCTKGSQPTDGGGLIEPPWV